MRASPLTLRRARAQVLAGLFRSQRINQEQAASERADDGEDDVGEDE